MKPEIFFEGYRAKKAEIAERGFVAARDSFNTQYPVGAKPASLDEYYRAYPGRGVRERRQRRRENHDRSPCGTGRCREGEDGVQARVSSKWPRSRKGSRPSARRFRA